jgi:hypothetical protein
VALVLGLAAGAISVWQTAPAHHAVAWAAGIVLGLTWGLGASGLYEAGKLSYTGLTSPGTDSSQAHPGTLGPLPPKPNP